MTTFLNMMNNDEGATAIEYGLIAALIAVACITALTSVGSQLNLTFGKVNTKLTSANAAP
jgi:pilus assembly protein Flp/PilA